MTTKEELVKSKLQTKVFNVIGKTVTFKKKGSPTYDDRGDEEDTTYTESDIIVVPYNIMFDRQTYESFGNIHEGEMDLAVPYTVDVEKDDRFIIDSIEYETKEITKNFLPGNVVTIVRVAKVQ